MRRILLLAAFINCVVLGSGVILRGLTHSDQHEPIRSILLVGLRLVFLTLIPLSIYVIRQMVIQQKQLRRYGIEKSDQQLQVEFHRWQAYQDTFSQTEHFIDWVCCFEFLVASLT